MLHVWLQKVKKKKKIILQDCFEELDNKNKLI